MEQGWALTPAIDAERVSTIPQSAAGSRADVKFEIGEHDGTLEDVGGPPRVVTPGLADNKGELVRNGPVFSPPNRLRPLRAFSVHFICLDKARVLPATD